MHDIISEALAYWERLRDGRAIPLRASFDPSDIPKLLPYVLFLDVLDEGRDFRFRVIGEKVRSVFFENYTGRTLSSLPHVEPDGPLLRALRKAVKQGAPVREPIEYVGPESEVVKRDEIFLPFANEQGIVTHILAFLILEGRPTPIWGT